MVRKLLILLVICCNIGCDQLSKDLVRKHVAPGEFIHLVQDYFILTNVENTGAALGLGKDLAPLPKQLLLNVLPLAVLLYICYRIFRRNRIALGLGMAFAFIIGGGIGNLIDRFLYSSVTDFFFARASFFKTGIFNMADVSVTVGALLLLYLTFWDKIRAHIKSVPQNEAEPNDL